MMKITDTKPIAPKQQMESELKIPTPFVIFNVFIHRVPRPMEHQTYALWVTEHGLGRRTDL